MKLIDQSQAPHIGIERTFRHSRTAPLIWLIVVVAATAWWTTAFALSEGASWQHWLPTGLGALMIAAVLWSLRTTMRPSNWLMHIAGDGVYIKFRSYLNSHYPDDSPTVLHVPFSEIRAVRAARKTVTSPENHREKDRDTVRFLEIELNHTDTAELAKALAHERALPPITNGASKFHDYPLRLVSGDTLGLLWNVSPGLRTAKETLAKHVTLEEDRVYPDLHWERISDEEKDALIVELADYGKRIAAKRLAAMQYGITRSEAGDYINRMMGRDLD